MYKQDEKLFEARKVAGSATYRWNTEGQFVYSVGEDLALLTKLRSAPLTLLVCLVLDCGRFAFISQGAHNQHFMDEQCMLGSHEPNADAHM